MMTFHLITSRISVFMKINNKFLEKLRCADLRKRFLIAIHLHRKASLFIAITMILELHPNP